MTLDNDYTTHKFPSLVAQQLAVEAGQPVMAQVEGHQLGQPVEQGGGQAEAETFKL